MTAGVAGCILLTLVFLWRDCPTKSSAIFFWRSRSTCIKTRFYSAGNADASSSSPRPNRHSTPSAGLKICPVVARNAAAPANKLPVARAKCTTPPAHSAAPPARFPSSPPAKNPCTARIVSVPNAADSVVYPINKHYHRPCQNRPGAVFYVGAGISGGTINGPVHSFMLSIS